jgi:hypothetical protein
MRRGAIASAAAGTVLLILPKITLGTSLPERWTARFLLFWGG